MWTSESTTLYQGATAADDCVPKQAQLAPEAGQAFFSFESGMQSLLTSTQQANLSACLGSCPAGSCCFAQYDVANSTCHTIALDPAAADGASGLQVVYKLPPSGLIGASSVSNHAGGNNELRASSLASGYYATCAVPSASASAWLTAGSSLGPDARTFVTVGAAWHTGATRAACRARCDDSNVCWGYLYDATNSACLYRGGVDALASRAFFELPTAADFAALKWAGNGPATEAPSL